MTDSTRKPSLSNAEYLVLSALEGGEPMALWEIAEDFVRGLFGMLPTPEEVAALLGPALTSLAEWKAIEVRRFDAWPDTWERGTPTGRDALAQVSRRAAAWSEAPVGSVVAGRITDAGSGWL